MAACSSTVDGSPWRQAVVGVLVLLIVTLAPVALTDHQYPAPSSATEPVHVKILAINDFHGQLPGGQNLDKEPAGSAPVLASYLEIAMTDAGGATTFIALPGDVVGASPPESGLLLDEPTLLYFNDLADDCSNQSAPTCNMIATSATTSLTGARMSCCGRSTAGTVR
jgi:5'-nucleotidase